jgi:mono/diheme cytochrome c family protein
MKVLSKLILLLLVLFTIAAGTAWSGVYDIAADAPHWPVTEQFLEVLRDRSIASRADRIDVPDLDDAALIRSAAGNYDVMCASCHLKPGKTDSELHRGLYPAPPAFAQRGIGDPAQAFWVIKHGIKMSGMPAWGRSMEDKYVWGLVAFARKLPQLTPEQYHDEVVASGGHHHGGGEDDHDHHEEHAATGEHADDHGHAEDHEHPEDHEHAEGAPAHDHP